MLPPFVHPTLDAAAGVEVVLQLGGELLLEHVVAEEKQDQIRMRDRLTALRRLPSSPQCKASLDAWRVIHETS